MTSPPTARRRPTIADVARVAQVSKTTVSRVLNDKPDVDQATKAAVTEVMTRLGYVPSSQAVGLARGKALSLGLLAPSISAPWMLEVLRGVTEAIESTDYSLTLFTMTRGRSSLEALAPRLRSQNIDGLAIMQPPYEGEDLRRLLALDVPIVAIDDRGAHPSLASVSGADDDGIQQAVAHLAGLGRRRLGMIAGPGSIPCHRDRLNAFRAALGRLGLEADRTLQVVTPNDDLPAGQAAARELLSRGADLDGLIVGNDAMALGALRELRRAEVAIPQQVAVVGFDDIAAARYGDPPLSTVYNPLYEMGQAATRLLLEAACGARLPDAAVLLPTRLVVRASSDPTADPPEEDLTHWHAATPW